MNILSPAYFCHGKADPNYIPRFSLAAHMEKTKARKRQYDEMCKTKKRNRQFYVKQRRDIDRIQLPRESIDLSGEPYGEQICEARKENSKLRQSRKQCDEPKRGTIIPEIKIDKVYPKLQKMPPSEWTFEAALAWSKSADDLRLARFNSCVSPCDTRTPDVFDFFPLPPSRAQSAPLERGEPKRKRGSLLKKLAGAWKRHIRHKSF